jgi:deoxyribose-phosphate aldolase
MTPAELDRLVAEIGDEILVRLGAPWRGEGLNIPDLICPDCAQRCVRTCAAKTREIVAAGASRVSASEKPAQVDPSLAALIDHTLLKPEASQSDIERVCAEARRHGFASVCVNPYWVTLAARLLSGSAVKVCTVVGFPLGATTTETKRTETEAALRCGAREIDMVQNVGALRSGDVDRVREDIAAIVDLAHRAGAIVKVILEAALLNDDEKVAACRAAQQAGADFVKTSTGFGPGGATAHDVALIRRTVGPRMGVKAAGGIRTLDDVKRMAEAGATRIGASASVKILGGADASGAGY